MGPDLAPRLRSHTVRLWRRGELLVRYGAVGLINTAFGYGLYAALVFAGLNLFLAQILSHCTGAVFNYAMFRRHVFTDSGGAVGRYIGAYAVNYGLGLAGLALFHRFVASPYLAGFLALVVVAAINFFILRLLVFRKTPAATPPPA
jgi:putative flippase GtrA